MRSKKKLKLRYLFLLLFIVFLFKEINSQKQGVGTFFNNVIGYTLMPVRFISKTIAGNVKDLHTYFELKRELHKENIFFKKKVMQLQWEKFLLSKYKEEALRYKNILGLKNLYTFNYAVAQVVGRDLFLPYYSILINKGSKSGIKKGMLALADSSVVGKIFFVNKNISKIVPLNDPRSIISAYLGRSRNFGILIGNGKKCSLEYLPFLTDVKLNDKVYTSGFSSIVPKGLYLGIVTKIIKKNQNSSPLVEVTPYDGLHKTEEILIITSTVNK